MMDGLAQQEIMALEGKRALITASSAGLGKAIVRTEKTDSWPARNSLANKLSTVHYIGYKIGVARGYMCYQLCLEYSSSRSDSA